MNQLKEDSLNDALALAMKKCIANKSKYIKISSERIGRLPGGKRADILVSFNHNIVAIEGEYKGGNPDKDAQTRLNLLDSLTDTQIKSAIAVIYPERAKFWQDGDEARSKLLAGELMDYAVFSEESEGDLTAKTSRFPLKGYISGDIWSLTDMAIMLTTPYRQIINLANKISNTIKSVSLDFKQSFDEKPEIKSELDIIVGRPKGLDVFPITSVIWLNSFLFQDKIAECYDLIRKRSAILSDKYFIPSAVYEAWQKIQEINYRSIYKPSGNSLKLLMDNIDIKVVKNSLESIGRAAEEIESNSLDIFDIGGELFQRIIDEDDRDNVASYYTKPIAAELLARIVTHKLPSVEINESSVHSNHCVSEKLQHLRIGDFACGTGTLLKSVYRQVLAIAHKKGYPKNKILLLHKSMMEKGLCGIDISPIAASLNSF